MKTFLDHIAVVAPDLASGADYVERALGVRPQPGGAHPRMGTHNLLMRLGENVYLEVIAPDPDAQPPGRARWFALDTIGPDTAPRLAAWVARTDDIVAARAACGAVPGEIEPMTRGALAWRITIPVDGALPEGGAAPALIQWDSAPHPASMLDDLGCTLRRLDVYHPEPSRVRRLLDALAFDGPVCVHGLPAGQALRLSADIQTPHGPRSLPLAGVA
ncbi:hypothetical protein CAL18_12750 [Bordetella genomosp. 7]|uniref:Glyoxalase-like domain-containing protein n=1 Tax=Bordetella genomosp. 7 TaxID=1416805 RepID=A0A261QZ48_9BORD|nr:MULTISPECIES: VOC family protein [Bordetella]OZI17991.1 hypothetical protein CAL19_13005 [Bordetella genomosp. 7]OZI21785.1 hypothetical protein CAL18_12750 [Bordetella genomosp. 7]